MNKMMSQVLSGKEAAADVRANLKKEAEGIKVMKIMCLFSAILHGTV